MKSQKGNLKRKRSEDENETGVVAKKPNRYDNVGFPQRRPLVEAIINKDLENCKKILEQSQDKNPLVTYGLDTALHVAAHCGSVEIFKMIADMVEDKNPNGEYKQTPLYRALDLKCSSDTSLENRKGRIGK